MNLKSKFYHPVNQCIGIWFCTRYSLSRNSLIHLPNHSPTHPLTYPLTHSLNSHSLTHPLTHSPAHPLTLYPPHSLGRWRQLNAAPLRTAARHVKQQIKMIEQREQQEMSEDIALVCRELKLVAELLVFASLFGQALLKNECGPAKLPLVAR